MQHTYDLQQAMPSRSMLAEQHVGESLLADQIGLGSRLALTMKFGAPYGQEQIWASSFTMFTSITALRKTANRQQAGRLHQSADNGDLCPNFC